MELNEQMAQKVTQAKQLASMKLGTQPWVTKIQQATRDASEEDLGTIVAAHGLLIRAQEQFQRKQFRRLRTCLDCAIIVLAALVLIRHRDTVAAITNSLAAGAWDVHPLSSGWAIMVAIAALLIVVCAISVIAYTVRRPTEH